MYSHALAIYIGITTKVLEVSRLHRALTKGITQLEYPLHYLNNDVQLI